VITALGAFAFAAAFLAVGRWGRRNATALVPSSFSEHARAREERSLRRGARSVTVLGALFACVGVLAAAGAAYDALIGTTR
jgi:hypothetical protein